MKHTENRTALAPGGGEPGVDRPLRVLGLYWQSSFWSMGRGIGANSFFLAPEAFARQGHEIHISMPRGKGQLSTEEDEGILLHRYRAGISFDSNPQRPLPIRLSSRLFRYLALPQHPFPRRHLERTGWSRRGARAVHAALAATGRRTIVGARFGTRRARRRG